MIEIEKRYILYWIISFIIISIFSFSRDPHIDETASLICSLYFFTECIVWDTQTPIFYFFIFPLTVFSIKIEFLRLILATLVSFSVVLCVKTLNIIKTQKKIFEIIILLSLSFTPIIYSLAIVRPYSLSLFLSAISTLYFVKYIKFNRLYYFKKSVLIDCIALLVFYFNILLLFAKMLFIFIVKRVQFRKALDLTVKNLKYPLITLIIYLASLIIVFSSYISWKGSTSFYEYFKEIYKDFLLNFPIELFKEQSWEKMIIQSDLSNFSKLISQFLFILPIFLLVSRRFRDEYVILYSLIFFTILFFNIAFSILTSRYLVLPRQFIYLSLPLTILNLIILSKRNLAFLILFLPLIFFDSSVIRLSMLYDENFIYFPLQELVEKIPENEEIMFTPFHDSQFFWYYYKFINQKNITLYDTLKTDWYKKYNEKIVLRYWNFNAKIEEIPIIYNYKVIEYNETEKFIKIFINIKDAKDYCKEILEEIKKPSIYILICR
ncbi:MAG: hypothetical protein QXT34_01715 [Candidatus Aenigmatarchaeota archaeon]